MKIIGCFRLREDFRGWIFFFEEGVCRWHMTDEKRNIDHKDIQIVQVIF